MQGERLSAERVVAEHAPRRVPTATEIRAMVEELGEMTRVLASGDPDDKARPTQSSGSHSPTGPATKPLRSKRNRAWAYGRVGGETHRLTPRVRLIRSVDLAA